MNEDQFYARLAAFLAETAEVSLGGVGPDDDLYALGLADSLTIIRMIVFVEELTGVEIDLGDHEFESFYTQRGLYSVAMHAGHDA